MTKRNTFILSIFVSFLFFLTACGSAQSRTTTSNTQEIPTENTNSNGLKRGIWDGNVYTNEWLGVRFFMPDNWVIATDEEIADLLGVASDILPVLGKDIPADFWEIAGVTTMHDMLVSEAETGNSVQIIFERLVFPNTQMTVEDLMESMMGFLQEVGINAYINPGTTQIGGYNWHSLNTELDVSGTIIYGRQFYSIRDNFARTIVITYSNDAQLEDFLSMFADSNSPIT
ncbi:MAG: hypothetical protein FWF57_08110 [Defluviitaleaceae bacterium]|nr:hypothetical protein [Defluviitaleaceae bacterium]